MVTGVLVLGIAVSDLIFYYLENRFSSSPLAAAARQRGPSLYEITPRGVRLRRFLDVEFVDPISGRAVAFRTNNFGYRGPDVGLKPPGEYRILVLGDSITLSSYTEEAEAYPAAIEAMLNGSAPSTAGGARPQGGVVYRVLNAGIAGAALREELHVLNETGLFTSPDLVLLGLFLDDAQRSHQFPMPEGLAAYSAIARRVSEMLQSQEITGEARKEYTRLSGRPYPEQPFPEGAWRHDPEAYEAEVAAACANWGRGCFPWTWEVMRPDIEVMQGLGRQHGFKLAVVLFPATKQWETEVQDDRAQRLFSALMNELELPHLDLLPVFRAEYRRQPRPLSYDHCHLVPEGSRIAAEAIAAFLRASVLPSNGAGSPNPVED